MIAVARNMSNDNIVARTEPIDNFVLRHHDVLRWRHYLLRANQAHHWFNAYPRPLETKRNRFGDDFCLVLWREGIGDDAYVIPYTRLKSLFIGRNLVHGTGRTLRWHGDIPDGQLRLRTTDDNVSVSDCYNAFDRLNGAATFEAAARDPLSPDRVPTGAKPRGGFAVMGRAR